MIGCTSGEPQNSCIHPLRDTLRAVQLQEGVEGVKPTIRILLYIHIYTCSCTPIEQGLKLCLNPNSLRTHKVDLVVQRERESLAISLSQCLHILLNHSR